MHLEVLKVTEDLKICCTEIFTKVVKNQASNRVKFENENIEAKIIEKFGDKNFGGLIGGEFHGSTSKKLEKAKDRDVGKVYFDVMDGKVNKIKKNKRRIQV